MISFANPAPHEVAMLGLGGTLLSCDCNGHYSGLQAVRLSTSALAQEKHSLPVANLTDCTGGTPVFARPASRATARDPSSTDTIRLSDFKRTSKEPTWPYS